MAPMSSARGSFAGLTASNRIDPLLIRGTLPSGCLRDIEARAHRRPHGLIAKPRLGNFRPLDGSEQLARHLIRHQLFVRQSRTDDDPRQARAQRATQKPQTLQAQ
jgi:hypothetical protein